MYCRVCGNLINDKAVMCVKCKNKPLLGRSYCQNCGAPTTPQQIACPKCGMKLRFELTDTEKRQDTIRKKMDSHKGTMRLMKWFLFADAVVAVLCLGVLAKGIAATSELSQYSDMVSNYYNNQMQTQNLSVIVILLGVFLTGLIELIGYLVSRRMYKKLQKQLGKK